MRPQPIDVGRILLALASFALLASLAAAQNSGIPARIKEAFDEGKRTVLQGNTHPLARTEFDRGTAPSDLPLDRMLLVLQRSREQEAASKHCSTSSRTDLLRIITN